MILSCWHTHMLTTNWCVQICIYFIFFPPMWTTGRWRVLEGDGKTYYLFCTCFIVVVQLYHWSELLFLEWCIWVYRTFVFCISMILFTSDNIAGNDLFTCSSKSHNFMQLRQILCVTSSTKCVLIHFLFYFSLEKN